METLTDQAEICRKVSERVEFEPQPELEPETGAMGMTGTRPTNTLRTLRGFEVMEQ